MNRDRVKVMLRIGTSGAIGELLVRETQHSLSLTHHRHTMVTHDVRDSRYSLIHTY
jgi:hypothetical protein